MGINQARFPGFYQPREFYAPRYDVADDRHNLLDKRTTLFWHPTVTTDSEGKAIITFFTADVTTRYRIIMEGIAPDG